MREFRSAYGDRNRVAVSFPEEGLTEQHHKVSCDIKSIIRQYDRTGLIQNVNKAQAFYGDFTAVNEFQESLNLVKAAQDHFMSLPSDLRRRFDNDPGKYLEFVSNPDNRDEMEKLGMIEPKAPSNQPEVKKTDSDAPAATE